MDPRLAIVNGFGRTLGDGIIGLEALHAARSLGALAQGVVLFRLVLAQPVIEDLYRLAATMAEVRVLPWADAAPARPFAGAGGFAGVLDIRDFAFDPAFRGVAMIDYFLARLGIEPRAVPPALRRNAWFAPLLPPLPGRGDYALLCPETASPLRTMPGWVRDLLADRLGQAGLAVRSQAVLPRARSLAELCRLIAGARLVVSADTAMVHLADALAVPCLAFFTTHEPRWRMRDYPLCRAVHVRPEGLPPALEFARSDADVAAVQAGWARFGAPAIERALADALQCFGN